jgi:hypothetical protein
VPVALATPAALPPLKLAAVAPAPAPVVIEKTVYVERVVQAKAPKPKPKARTQTVRNDPPAPYIDRNYNRVSYQEPVYQQPVYREPVQRSVAQDKPNYVGIGTGAVIGGLLGNQVGGGNGKKLATVAGIIAGGMIGNEVQNRQEQNAAPQQR